MNIRHLRLNDYFLKEEAPTKLQRSTLFQKKREDVALNLQTGTSEIIPVSLPVRPVDFEPGNMLISIAEKI